MKVPKINKYIVISVLVASCSRQEKNDDKISLLHAPTQSEWTVYEGKWKTNEGILRIELTLQAGAPGVDARFELIEEMGSTNSFSGAISRGNYTIFFGQQNNETVIRLNNLRPNNQTPYFRQSKSWLFDTNEEMYFVSRGSNELLPCDRDFRVYSTEKAFALHKRSDPFTVEGYITFSDSVDFFERNTGEHWKVSDLGEYDTLQIMYDQMAKEKFEGVYLKALAYTVSDSVSIGENRSLVIKRILTMGRDPD
jgi:hypothetical protein